MDTNSVVGKLIEVHREYQTNGGFNDADRVSPETKPLEDLKEFESDFIPEIVRRVARELGFSLQKGTRVRNIYVERGRKLTIREIAKKLVEKYAPKGIKV